ncbi:hypothetical protein SS50377_27223 [Spironucleus salmonicida]|uniref:Uncharacterized protein n=1 Tax=Spironucleus salmonicida TaxID=348837 RepID=V6M6B4_9EUKA|nr:hypothetical protein SS50377_27223 [Spironucleus salmonicida]|eukprot:EST48939.1 Hypothetical protein SS50377_10782 [Spironucleus salmonicida]
MFAKCCKPKRVLSLQFSPSSIEFAGRISVISDEVNTVQDNNKYFADEENTDEFEVINKTQSIKEYISTITDQVEESTTRQTIHDVE